MAAAKKKAPKIEFVPCSDDIAPPARPTEAGAIVDRDPAHEKSRVFASPLPRWALAIVPAATFPYRLVIVDVEQATVRETSLVPGNFSEPCFHPTGDRALVVRGNKELHEIVLATGETRLLHDLQGKVPRAYGATYAAEGTIVLVCDQCTLLLDADSGGGSEPIDTNDTAGFSVSSALGGACALALSRSGTTTYVLPLAVKGRKLHALKKVKRPGFYMWTHGDQVLSSDGPPPKERWQLAGLRESLDAMGSG